MPQVITFIGWHDSGKTTLVGKVIRQLRSKGYRVAVIKSSSDATVRFDTPGTDTEKHKQAGADSVMFVGPDQMVLQTGNDGLSLQTLAHRYFPDVDIVIGEGFKKAHKTAKIEVLRNPAQQLRNEVHGVIAVATDLADIVGDSVFRLDDDLEIAEFIEKRFQLGQPKGVEKAALLVNGNKVYLKNFIQDALAGTVHGFVSSLDITEGIDEIEIRIKIVAD